MKIKTTAFLTALVMILTSCDDGNAGTSDSAKTSTSETSVNRGTVLHTQYFDVNVTDATFVNKVNTGNEFSDLPAEEGNKYVVLDLTIKNTDTESRMMFDGVMELETADGKTLKYEQSEMVAADGFGIIMDNINPGMTKKTKVVYKVPANLNAKVFYLPGRGEGKIYCTTLNP